MIFCNTFSFNFQAKQEIISYAAAFVSSLLITISMVSTIYFEFFLYFCLTSILVYYFHSLEIDYVNQYFISSFIFDLIY